MIKNFPLGHLKISQGDLKLFLSYVEYCVQHDKKSYCMPLHITKYEVSKRDQKLKKVINSANIVIADGVPISWFCRRMGYRRVCHVAGLEFAEAIISQSNKQKWKIFLLGAYPENLEKAIYYINKKYNNPKIVGAHDGYFNPGDLDKIIDNINSLEPDILFLGLGMPQKEYFIHDYFNKIAATFWLPVGGTFDIWAHTKKRCPSFIQKMGLEWIQRSIYNQNKAKNVLKHSFSFFMDFLFYKR